MRDYIIVTDATADLPPAILDKFGIVVIPMEFEMGGNTYQHYPDARNLDFHAFYEKLRSGELSVTTQINYNTYIDYFEPILKENKDILYICFSSGLSGTYNTSLIAVEDLKEKYPESRIITIDSRSASVGEGMYVYNAALQKQKGMPIDELSAWLMEYRPHCCHWFTVDDLNHLKRGGRMTALTAAIGTMLSVKPVLHVDDDGHLIPVSKARGRKRSLEELVEHMSATCINPQDQVIFIGHGDVLEDAKLLEEMVREKFPVVDVIINHIGPIIGTHSGPGTIALFFYGTER